MGRGDTIISAVQAEDHRNARLEFRCRGYSGRRVVRRDPRVWNERDPRVPSEAVYVGRPTKWGNPYSHLPNTKAAFRVETRDEAIAAYRTYLEFSALIFDVKRELEGLDLVCWCAPQLCHADILLEIANG